MSAYIVGHDHIDALLTFASDKRTSYYLEETGGRVNITSANVDEVGRILLHENERSVRHRYSDHGDDLPGTIGERADSYRFCRWSAPLSAVSILKACSCFDYQACETDDYEKSIACRIVDAIRRDAIRAVPGYDNAPGWEFRRERQRRAS